MFRIRSLRRALAQVISFIAIVLSSSAVAAEADLGLAQVRQVPAVNGGGTVEGSIHMMSGGSITLNGGATITGDLLVPGTPVVRTSGKPNYGGTLDGVGPTAPSSYTITLNGQATLRNVVRRTAPLSLPAVATPPAPAGTRSVTLNSATQPVGDWTTLRNLTLNGNVGQIAVPPGSYGDFIANGGSGFTLGIAGATTPAVYDLQRLTLNGQARIDVVGPVVLNLANGLAANGALGASAHPDWLALNIASGGLTLNGGCTIHAFVTAPAAGTGTVLINGNSALVGGLVADKLIVNGGGLLRLRRGGGGPDPVNTAPVAHSQSLSTAEDTELAFTLAATDAENNPLSYYLVSLPASGSLRYASGASLPAPGAALASTALLFKPALDSMDPVTVTFRARDDGGAESNLATVSIAITPVNDAPIALPLAIRTLEDTPVNITLSGADRDGTIVSYTVSTAGGVTASGEESPALFQGSLTGDPPALTYHPKADFSGSETFTYTVSDDQGTVSAPVSVRIVVDPVNDRPVAHPQALELPEDQPITIQLSATDAEGQPLDYFIETLPAHGTLTLGDSSPLPPTGRPLPRDAGALLRYQPGLDLHEPAGFTFSVFDGELRSEAAPIQFTILPVNDTPVAAPGEATTLEDAAVVIALAASDIDGDSLRYELATPPAHGTVSISGQLATYTPAADYHGTDAFAFTASDRTATSAPALVNI